MSGREFEVIVWGATGYTGRLVAEHLLKTYGADGDLKWAMAGRSADKLAEVKAEIGAPASLPTVIADAAHPASLDAMVRRADAVISTVGPYQLYGAPLVEGCAVAGTDYVDLTGESNWIAAMIVEHQTTAHASGAGWCSPAASTRSRSTSGCGSPRRRSKSATAPTRPGFAAACGD